MVQESTGIAAGVLVDVYQVPGTRDILLQSQSDM
jgi:hypothetical protein